MSESTEVRTDGNSLLKAVYLSRLRLTRLLLEGGAYINESNDLGETPLMVACKTHHADTQSVPKHKIVRYLLENGADPNIQDKTGKTALMHACLEQAGAEILSLLLNSGADPTLEDHRGLSALVYAVNSGNRNVLSVLLDACKANGKEVIIITTNKLPSGHQMTKQYLNVPPPPELEDQLQYVSSSCSMSPYETQLRTPPQGSSANASPQPGSPLLGLKHPQSSCSSPGLVPSQPGSPIQNPSALQVPGVDKRLNFQRLHYEQWPKSSSMLLQQCQSSSLTEDQTEITPEEELTLKVKNIGFHGRTPTVSRHQSIDVKDAAGLLKALENMSGNGTKGGSGRKALGRKMSYDSAASSQHSASHPNLHQDESLLFPRESNPAGKESSDCLQQLNVSSLQNVVRRRNIGIDHYSSDSQLPQLRGRDNSSKNSGEARTGLEKLRLVNSRSFTLYGSKESLESPAQRRVAVSLERRGSGALLLDHISHTRPGYLPSLKPHAPIPNIGVNPTGSYPVSGCMKTLNGGMTGSKPIVPCAPLCSKDPNAQKILWRRHSMQNEQLTYLVNFEETCGSLE
ncbi:ankyrin repeat domain 34Bb [Thalassophryne amazonica]|uniref:ankyrin repeat domain 34Bb n=1 Tax=Thalassophryne amazonica TaxID=390379 RepID=UPI001471D6CE|nr:ankyrin repeat domain 34Bb [Thalassophryne amazonica]